MHRGRQGQSVGAEDRGEVVYGAPSERIYGRHGRDSERGERGHRVVFDSARNDELEVLKVRRDVERKAVHRDPARDLYADGADLGGA